MAKPSQVHGRRAARTFKPVTMTQEDVAHAASLRGIGIQLDNEWIQNVMAANGVVATMDSNDVGPSSPALSGLTTPSIAAQIQFLQTWLPGFVQATTAARNIDKFIGMQTVGAWEDEEVVQGILEPIGNAVPYLDHTNVPLASWNANFERRTIVRFELGLLVGTLEEMRSARMRLSTAAEKRKSVKLALDIQRNRVGFYGYNGGQNRTYGFLNDPSLPAYQTVATGAGGSTDWADKTFLEIVTDILGALTQLRTNSKDVIDPGSTPITMAVATAARDRMSTVNALGTQSVMGWLKETYPNVRVESAPELDDANGGVGVFYMFADKLDDGSTDDSAVFAQIVPAVFMALGVEKRSKSYVEDFANATAGTMCKRPFAVVRFSGIS